MLFMLLSAVDVYSLMILTSKIGSKPSLSAPFAKRTRTWIFWVGLFALIKKEIPQFIIVVRIKKISLFFFYIIFFYYNNISLFNYFS